MMIVLASSGLEKAAWPLLLADATAEQGRENRRRKKRDEKATHRSSSER